MNQKRLLIHFAVSALFTGAAAEADALLGSGFTYQEQLKQEGAPLNDSADFEFTLCDNPGSSKPWTGENQVGDPVAINDVDVVNGPFSVELAFGAAASYGATRYLQIAIRRPHDPFSAGPYRYSRLPAPGERLRDRIATSGQKCNWTCGTPNLGRDMDRPNGSYGRLARRVETPQNWTVPPRNSVIAEKLTIYRTNFDFLDDKCVCRRPRH